MKRISLIMVLPLAVMVSGCFGVSSEFRSYQQDFVKYSGIKSVDKDVELSFGRLQLYVAEKLTSVADRDLLAEMTIQDISKFELGVYESEQYNSQKINFTAFEKVLKDKGWSNFIKTRDGEDITNIYLNLVPDKLEISELIILTIDSQNIVLMRFKGNFNRIVERLIKARKLALK